VELFTGPWNELRYPDNHQYHPQSIDLAFALTHRCALGYIGDFDGECDVDFADFAIFALAWWTEPGDAQWNPDCDISIPADNKVDWRDFKILCDNWLAGVDAECNYNGICDPWEDPYCPDCGGVDIDLSTDVGIGDLLIFTQNWLEGSIL